MPGAEMTPCRTSLKKPHVSDVGDMVKGLSSSEERRRGEKIRGLCGAEAAGPHLICALCSATPATFWTPAGQVGTGSAAGGKQAESQQHLCEVKSEILLSVGECLQQLRDM